MTVSELPTNSTEAPVATALDLLQALVNTVTEAPGLAQIPVGTIKSVEITPDGFQVKYFAPLAGVNSPGRQRVTLTASVDRWMDIPLAIPAATPPATTPTEQEPADMSFDADDAIIQAATYLTPVTATVPTVAENVITIPVKEGVIYYNGTTVVTDTITLEEDDQVTITAVAATNYVLSGPATWTFAYVAPLIPVTPTEPTVAENVITIPVEEGVVYSQGETVVTGTITLEENDEVTITASAAPGYVLSGLATWTFAYVATDPDPDPEDPENP